MFLEHYLIKTRFSFAAKIVVQLNNVYRMKKTGNLKLEISCAVD